MNVTWSSGSAGVATVNSSGLVTAVAPGSAIITATTVDGGFTSQSAITVEGELVTSVKPLYNGIISSMRWRTDKAFETTGEDFTGMYVFDYDEKYQIRDATWAIPDYALNTFQIAGNKFRTVAMDYDPNGNILALKRYDKDGNMIHNFKYHYQYQEVSPEYNNKLKSVDGYVNAYSYNALGQMIGEDKSGIGQYVEYDVTGKVTAVFGDANHTDRKVKYLYDDRGFRLAKVSYWEANRTTWYIRDASGNVISTYEQSGVPSEANAAPIVQTEVPLYGSGKLGTYYPAQDASVNYEITDHLGNVRALLREDVMEFAATMEDNNQEDYNNPRVQEMAYFQNLFETEMDDPNMNHTSNMATVVTNPSKAAYLFWVDGMAGMEATDKSIGPAIAREVNPGDIIYAEAFVRYENKINYQNDITPLLLGSLLGNSFVSVEGFEAYSLAETAQSFNSALTASAFFNDNGDESRPFAYINYIIFDETMTHVDSKRVRVSEDAGFDPPEASLPNQHKRVYFENEIVIPPTGKYIYLWVSNESENTKVWFDDFTVTHLSTFVAQATDFGVWGDVLREQKADASSRYRFGYQGQFSEKDEETGWNHFELREYDPIIGRWNGKDAYKQYWSPYIGMGNNPVSGIDRDGGFRTRFGAWLYKIGNGGGDLEQAIGGANAGEWYVGNQIGYNGLGVAYQRKFDWGNGNKSFGDHVWNHPFTRYQIPDFVTIGAGYNGIAMAGAGTSFEMNWVLRGQEASWKPAITVTQSLGVGYSVDATINVGGANYLGNANDIRRSMLVTSIGEGGVTYWRSAGVALGGKIGVTGAYTPTTTGYGIIGRYLNVGGGLPLGELPFNAAGGVSNTFIIKDFHKK